MKEHTGLLGYAVLLNSRLFIFQISKFALGKHSLQYFCTTVTPSAWNRASDVAAAEQTMQKPVDFLVPVVAGLVWYGLTNYQFNCQNINKNRAPSPDWKTKSVFLSLTFF